ncbi:MAG: hypothetical protein Q8L48_28340 [Archangium sp.]|nr:hypothetical protein [Archangium sp.]
MFAVGCGKCTKPTSGAAGGGIERVLPRGAVGVVVVPALASAGQKLRILEALKVTAFAAQLRGFDDGKGFADALVGELGIDVRSAEALEKAGVDGTRGAALAVLVTGHAYLALPVKDAAKFHATLQTLAKQRLGAGAAGEQKFGELTVKTFSVGAAPKLGYVLSNGYALLTDAKGIEKLAGLAAMTDSDSLASDKAYAAEVEKLPKDRDVVVYLPTGTPVLAQAPFSAVTGAISLTPAGLSVLANASWKGDPAQLAALETQPSRSLLGYLPADAFLVTRYSGDPSKLSAWSRQLLGTYLARAFDDGGFDLKTQVLDQLQPGVVASLSLSERPPMDKGMPSLDLRQTNPFTYAHLSGAAAVKSPAAVVPSLEKMAALAPKFGAEMSLRERPDGQKALITTYAQGEGVHLAPKGDLVFFASPVQRLDALVKSDGAGVAMTGLGDEAVTVVIDLNKLAASVRALPESAWGLGGFAIKATTVRWLDATDDLKRVTISVGAKDRVVQAKVMLTLGGAAR